MYTREYAAFTVNSQREYLLRSDNIPNDGIVFISGQQISSSEHTSFYGYTYMIIKKK